MRRIILHPSSFRLPSSALRLPASAFRLPASASRLLFSALCLLFSVLCLPSFALTDSWGVDVNAHTAVQRTYKQGETWEMRIDLRDGLKPLNLTGATARFYWYTNSTDNVWWTNSATVYAPALGVVSAPWTPAMDTGAASYAYWFGIWPAGSTSPLWRVTGTIRLLPSPGFTPNTLVPPVRTLDFAAITLTNAPWVTASDWQSGSNALAAALQDLSVRVDAIPPPPVIPVSSVNGSTGDVVITAASLGALTAELDQAALAALAAFASTNKLTRWQDASEPSTWWEARGGTNLTAWTIAYPVWTITATGTDGQDGIFQVTPPTPLLWPTDSIGTYSAAGGWYVIHLPDTIFVGNTEIGGGTIGWYNSYSSGDPAGLTAYNSFISEDPVGIVTLVRSGSISTNIVGSYNLTTGNVWQAVSAVRQTADDAQLAADQAATLINYHTTLDPAPHAGKFVTPLQLTNALAGAGSIIQPIRLASTNIVISATNAVYALALTNAANIGVDVSALSLGGTNCAAATVFINCLTTQALESVFNTNSVAFDMPWEPTVTGRYELVISSDGVRTTARQVWPKNDTAQFGYVKYNYAGTSSTFPNLSAIAAGSTNGAVYTWVSCPNCMYAVRAQFSGGNEGDTVTFGYYRFVLGFADFISPSVARTIINPGSPYGFSSGWIFVPSPVPSWLGGPGFANGVGLWVTRSSSTALVRCTVLEVRKANALEIKAAQAMGL